MGLGSSTLSRMIRRRPSFSVTSIVTPLAPSEADGPGKNARLHGFHQTARDRYDADPHHFGGVVFNSLGGNRLWLESGWRDGRTVLERHRPAEPCRPARP